MFIVAGYNFKSAVNNIAIRQISIYARCRWLCRRRRLHRLASCVENFASAIISFVVASDCLPFSLSDRLLPDD
jgi:hypothetical protein